MPLTRSVSLLALTFFAVSAFGEEAPTPPEFAATVADSVRLGNAIYRHDRAASIATDAVLEVQRFRRDKRVQGWITQEKGSDIEVTFAGANGDGVLEGFYRATVPSNAMLSGSAQKLDPPQALGAAEIAMFNARNLALSSGFERCARTYNAVVLPDARGSEPVWAVYLLPGTDERDVIAAGGNYRVDIAYDGSKMLGSRAFSKTCLMIRPELPDGASTAAVVLRHFLDPVPTEIHVFLSLAARTEIALSTTQNNLLWWIERGTIKYSAARK
jgi:hypothetical protein